MTLLDTFYLFGLFIIFLGVGFLLYCQLLGLLLRFHIILFPKMHTKFIQHQTTKHELDCLHSLIAEWEQSVFSGTSFIQQLRDKKEISDWKLRAITHEHYIQGLAYCVHGLRKALSLPKKFSLQPTHQENES